MEGRVNPNLSNFLLVQKSINHVMPYDAIEQIIHQSIESIKKQSINARISNVVFNINGELVLAQVYVERKNAFAATKDNKFGTSPTAYNVQVRFPFGLETRLGQQNIVLPGGTFNRPLQPYKNHIGKVVDDVQRDSDADDLICGSGIQKEINEEKDRKQIKLFIPEGEFITFSTGHDIGKGYEIVPLSGEKEYAELKDYNCRLKMHGLYPLFYSDGAESKSTILRRHEEYPGYTLSQRGRCEDSNGSTKRLSEYKSFLTKTSEEITRQKVGQRWAALSLRNKDKYVLDISIINGVTLYTESGLPVTRLRDYQLELFQSCLDFVERVEAKPNSKYAGKINMGVGAGKTFFTFTFLQHLKYKMQTTRNPAQIKPPFCMAPDEDVANVTKRSIDRQGITSGTSAFAITKLEQIPNSSFVSFYETLSHHAQDAASTIDKYIQNGLQQDILKFCHDRNYHPLTIINLLYTRYRRDVLNSKVATFKDSIDVKRLLLMVEGQKTILNKTGMLGIEALSNLLEQFTAIRQGTEKGYEFKESKADISPQPKINYNQSVYYHRVGHLNIAKLTQEKLLEILQKKHEENLRAIRETLIRMACLADKDAAILLANSGGLGNTYTAQELKQQIDTFLPIAVTEITTLANKEEHTGHDHYTLRLYLNELYPTVPSGICLNHQLNAQGIDRDNFQNQVYQESINFNLQLIRHIEDRIAAKIKELGTISELKLPEEKTIDPLQWGAQPSDNPIKAANQLAGIASLGITGHASADDAKLLLSHVPVFTPEGLACYVEYLAKLVGQPKLLFTQKLGVYKITRQKDVLISKKNIQERLQQILSAIMIADEVHKEEFHFLYDTNSPIYKKIDAVTQHFLGKPFCEVLPPRIGMSGTLNQVSDKAFGEITLYHLSTQRMIEQGLLKQVSILKQPLALERRGESKAIDSKKWDKQAYAKQVVIDYFVQNTQLSIRNLLKDKSCAIDLFEISKGLIFSKVVNAELNGYIAHYFNLLIQEKITKDEDKAIQTELFERINEQRMAQAILLQGKLQGEAPLTEAECVQIKIYNDAHSRHPIHIAKEAKNQVKIISKVKEQKEKIVPLTPKSLQATHRNMFLNNLFAIYLEYVLSKSNAPKEFSDIVGLQNKLHEDGQNLITGIQSERDILELMQGVDPKSMTQEDIAAFIKARIKDTELSKIMINGITQFKNNANRFAEHLTGITAGIRLDHLVTSDRHEFESGKTLAMLGSPSEQTGYSHEPVGIVVDAPSANDVIHRLNDNLAQIKEGKLKAEDIKLFLSDLQDLSEMTFSYDEKNQVGGRALRTPYGHVKYVQYQSNINHFLAEFKGEIGTEGPLEALKVETEFEDIFTANETLAQQERASITFNRFALSLLKEEKVLNAVDFSQAVATHFSEQLRNNHTKKQYENYIAQRLPLLWAMKYNPQLACDYFLKNVPHVLNEIRSECTFVLPLQPQKRMPTSVDEKQEDGLNLTIENNYSLTKPALIGGAIGLTGSAALSHYYATTSTASATTAVFGVKASIFIAASTVMGAAFFLLIAAVSTYCLSSRYPGFFSCCWPSSRTGSQQLATPANSLAFSLHSGTR